MSPAGSPAATPGRRQAAGLALTALLLAGCAGRDGDRAVPADGVREIAPGVHLSAGALEDWGPENGGHVANLGFVVGERCVAVIDSGGTRAGGEALEAAVRRRTDLPICYVVNTHAHPDHVLGNEAFLDANGPGADAPRFVGHRRLPAALAARGPFYLNLLARNFGSEQAGTRIVPPDVTVDDRLALDLGGRRLLLRAWPTAHTDADLSVLDEHSGTLFLGDLLFAGHMPVVDGSLSGWLAALGELRGWQQIQEVVPGHGAPSGDWPAALDAQQRYLERLRADTRAAIKAGLTLSQAVERIEPDRPGWLLQDVFHQRNVTAAYAELEWE